MGHKSRGIENVDRDNPARRSDPAGPGGSAAPQRTGFLTEACRSCGSQCHSSLEPANVPRNVLLVPGNYSTPSGRPCRPQIRRRVAQPGTTVTAAGVLHADPALCRRKARLPSTAFSPPIPLVGFECCGGGEGRDRDPAEVSWQLRV